MYDAEALLRKNMIMNGLVRYNVIKFGKKR